MFYNRMFLQGQTYQGIWIYLLLDFQFHVAKKCETNKFFYYFSKEGDQFLFNQSIHPSLTKNGQQKCKMLLCIVYREVLEEKMHLTSGLSQNKTSDIEIAVVFGCIRSFVPGAVLLFLIDILLEGLGAVRAPPGTSLLLD